MFELSSGRRNIQPMFFYSNKNLAFFGFFNCPFDIFELIPSYMFWEDCNLRNLITALSTRFTLLCLLCLTVSVFTIIQPVGWEFGVLADPFHQGMPTLVLKWGRASRRSAVISEWSSFRALFGEMAGKRPAMGTLCIMLLGLAGTQQLSDAKMRRLLDRVLCPAWEVQSAVVSGDQPLWKAPKRLF